MSIVYKVKEGECLSSISKDFGHFWKTIWLEPDNSDLRLKRHNPNALLPNDILFVPDISVKHESAQTDVRHRYLVKNYPALLRIRIILGDKPLSGIKYVLNLGTTTINGTTDDEGRIEEVIDPTTNTGAVVLQSQGRTIKLPIRLGYIDPCGEVSGAQGRLFNLGYGPGPIDGKLGPQTERAIKKFQKDHELEQNGKLNDTTARELSSEYGG